MQTATMTQEPDTDAGAELGEEAQQDCDGEPQRRAALARANQVRLARAEFKRRIAEGDLSAAKIILDSPDEASSWAVWDVLMSQRRWGASKCRKFLSSNNISETKQLGQLTTRQRELLASQLRSRGARQMELV
jgi:hypothetical protein